MGAPVNDELVDWLESEDVDPDTESIDIGEYDLTSTPNDFNVKTIVDFLKSGVFEVPSFQRNFVWDLRRASKLIESLILGLPVPQLFLYESRRNRFLVVDGQQRLMSIYYFIQKRFPRMEKRSALRRFIDEKGQLAPEHLENDEYFSNFDLKLPSRLPSVSNPLDSLNYDTLGPEKTTLDLRTIRSVIIKQNKPDIDLSSVYEIFNRLNTGGMNLTPQEIRTSLYPSDFYKLLYRLNLNPRWREVIGATEPDLRLRDIEILLRGFAMLIDGDKYSPSMTRFLNVFSKSMTNAGPADLKHLEEVFLAFLEATNSLRPGVFGTRSRKLNVSVFESVFAAAAAPMYEGVRNHVEPLSEGKVDALKSDREFIDAASTKSTDKKKVAVRLAKARSALREDGNETDGT